MEMNPLKKLEALGQAIWLDFINRDLMTSGKLQHLINEDGLRGITSNPSIFESAIAESHAYDKDIQIMTREGKTVNTIYEALSQRDIQNAADKFHDVYHKTQGKDGYVSLEVNPHLARDTKGTIAEARRLWQALDRPNVFIKVPGTCEGLPAITQLISEGINVNVTLLFSVPRYQEVAKAYIAGLEARAAKGKPLTHIASVASFFLSRIDVLVDPMLEQLITQGDEKAILAKQVHGQVAIASAKSAYQFYNELIISDRFQRLADQGAKVQRLLWASTSTKNPLYSDIKYVEALIGVNTVNTIPMETLDAYRDHGKPKLDLTENITKANEVFQQLAEMGINLAQLTQQLENEGVAKFSQSFDQLTAAVEKKMKV
jgi:transaldolase